MPLASAGLQRQCRGGCHVARQGALQFSERRRKRRDTGFWDALRDKDEAAKILHLTDMAFNFPARQA